MSRYYIDMPLRYELMKEDKTDCGYPIVDSKTFLHVAVMDVHTLEMAEKVVNLLNKETK